MYMCKIKLSIKYSGRRFAAKMMTDLHLVTHDSLNMCYALSTSMRTEFVYQCLLTSDCHISIIIAVITVVAKQH